MSSDSPSLPPSLPPLHTQTHTHTFTLTRLPAYLPTYSLTVHLLYTHFPLTHSYMYMYLSSLPLRTLLLRILRFTVLISVCTHFVACLWYILGCQARTCHSDTWASTANLVNTTMNDADHYLNSLYWSMATMTTTGPLLHYMYMQL